MCLILPFEIKQYLFWILQETTVKRLLKETMNFRVWTFFFKDRGAFKAVLSYVVILMFNIIFWGQEMERLYFNCDVFCVSN